LLIAAAPGTIAAKNSLPRQSTKRLCFSLCCQSGNAARRGHPKNWCGAGCGHVPDAISVTRTLIYLILKYYTVERKKKLKYLKDYSKFMKYS